jgi:hypothetical protein
MIVNIQCVLCEQPATWMRYTQFAGDHPFCEKHAYDEMGKESNDGDWEKIDHDISNNNEHNRPSLDR